MEIWKDVVNYEGMYKVSNLGNVVSLERKVKKSIGVGLKTIKRRIMKQQLVRGYPSVGLTYDGNTKMFCVHQLMAITFLNHTPNGHSIVVDHIDNDKLNNNINNLQLISNRDNTSKDRKNGSSKYVGVSWSKRLCKWRADIQIKGKAKTIGYFNDEYEASLAYSNELNRD
jgi:hypothetical protein